MAGTVAALLLSIISAVLVASAYRYRFSKGFDLIGITLFSITCGIAVALWCMTWRRRAIAIFIVIVLYAGSYSVLSAQGDYFWSQSGKLRYNNGTGLAVTDCVVWQPRWLYCEPFVNVYGTSTSRGTVLGYFFMPLLQCDRKWIHPTKPHFSDD
jgi:hypothetical protein